MAGYSRVHDRAMLDALEAIEPIAFEGDVWRVTRKGRDPLRASTAHGRWSPPAEFEVLYTSLSRDGALAEIGYRLSLEPVWPSRMQHEIHRIGVRTQRTLRLARAEDLASLGVNTNAYATFEYDATQAIAAAAHFLAFDGLLVPSARSPGDNLVLFAEHLTDEDALRLLDSADIDWTAWRKLRRSPPE